MSVANKLLKINNSLPQGVTLVAVSKTKPHNAIADAYDAGQRIFGENRVQELAEKYAALPKDIHWHMIGHLQRKKVKQIASFVSLIHGVDSLSLLEEINKRALQNHRIIPCLLQIHIAQEQTKFGLTLDELNDLLGSKTYLNMKNVQIQGLMGMATFTNDQSVITKEFSSLKTIFDQTKSVFFEGDENFKTISMGMSGDYLLAIECGSTMVRVGSAIFGGR